MKKALAAALTLTLSCFAQPAAAQFGAMRLPCIPGFCPDGAMPGAQIQQPWLRHLAQAREFGRRKDWLQSASSSRLGLEMVDRALQANPNMLAQYAHARLGLLKTLGDSLVRQGKAAEALPHLEQALGIEEWEIEQRSATGNPGLASHSTSEMIAAFSATMSLNKWAGVYLNRRLITPEMEGGPIDVLLADRLPEVDLTALQLVEAYVQAGRASDAYAVYDGPFSRYLKRQTDNPNPAARANLDVALETACFRMGISLAALGRSPQADAAFDCALRHSAKNFVELGVNNTVSTIMEAFAERRRFFLGAYAAYVLQGKGGQGVDVQSQRMLMQLVAETKGVSSRYRERRRSIWTHSQDPAFFRNRQVFVEHERSLTQMNVGGNLAMAMAMWMNQESILMNVHHEAFNRAGLQNVFSPGDEILRRTQAALLRKDSGKEASTALIGYAVYRPVDFKSSQLSPSRMLRYVFTEDGLDVRDIGAASVLGRQARLWRGDMVTGKTKRSAPVASKRATDLSSQLLGDLPRQALDAQNWVIDPDGVLSLLPFEALVLPGAQEQPVIERHTLRYVTSIADFADPTDPAGGVSATGDAVVVGDPLFTSVADRSGAGAASGLRTASGKRLHEITLTPLPDTRTEALQVAASLKLMGVASRVHLADKATVDAFRFTQAPRFLHVATHGLFLEPGIELANGTYVRLASALPGMQSALALSPGSGDGAESNFLTGADITRLNLLGTELVVFSACDTGNGEIEAGEGVVSLRRSVEEAGARSSITSLWPVPSASTTILMADFYARLGAGQSKSEALRQAKLALMKTSPDPVHWAGFLLAGEP